MRNRLLTAAITMCFVIFLLSLSGCKRESKTAGQSASPEAAETASAGIEAAPSDEAGPAAPIPAEQEILNFDAGVYKLETNIEYIADLDGDGVPDRILLRRNDPPWSCDVLYNGEKINEGDDWKLISQAHLIRRADDLTALIYQQDGDGGICTTSIYTFADGIATRAEYCPYAHSFQTPDVLQLTAQVYYFLGNQGVSIEAAIGEDFTLELGNDGWFTVIPAFFDTSMPEREYRAKVDIPMQRFENGAYTDAALPAGTRVYPQLINEAQTKMIMKTDDGTLWMYTRDSAGLHFEEDDLFEGCVFAGP